MYKYREYLTLMRRSFPSLTLEQAPEDNKSKLTLEVLQKLIIQVTKEIILMTRIIYKLNSSLEMLTHPLVTLSPMLWLNMVRKGIVQIQVLKISQSEQLVTDQRHPRGTILPKQIGMLQIILKNKSLNKNQRIYTKRINKDRLTNH